MDAVQNVMFEAETAAAAARAANVSKLRDRARMKRHANSALYDLNHNRYHDSIPVYDVDVILAQYGYNTLEPAIYCGREGQIHEQVDARTWLTMTWYKMESGRYEIVAYLS